MLGLWSHRPDVAAGFHLVGRLPGTHPPAGTHRWRTAAPCLEEPAGELAPVGDGAVVEGQTTKMTAQEIEEVGNLVADDEWLGLTMELAIVMRSAVRESTKGAVREFTGSDEYKVGDISKEMDARIKDEVAKLRGKDEYELGDLSIALDGLVKEEVKKLSGKDECTCPQRRNDARVASTSPLPLPLAGAACRRVACRYMTSLPALPAVRVLQMNLVTSASRSTSE